MRYTTAPYDTAKHSNWIGTVITAAKAVGSAINAGKQNNTADNGTQAYLQMLATQQQQQEKDHQESNRKTIMIAGFAGVVLTIIIITIALLR